MKRTAAFCLVCLLLLSGCREKAEPEPYTAVVDGQQATVIFEEGTRSSGMIQTEKGDYAFAYRSAEKVDITYPNGYVCGLRISTGGNSYAIASPADYDSEKLEEELGYLGYMSILWTIEEASENAGSRREKKGNPLVGLLMIALGAWNILSPRSAWWLSHGWRYKNAEPSDLALAMYRLSGGVAAVIGVIMMLV